MSHFRVRITDEQLAEIDGTPLVPAPGESVHDAVLDRLQRYAQERDAAVRATVNDGPDTGHFLLEISPDGSSRLLDAITPAPPAPSAPAAVPAPGPALPASAPGVPVSATAASDPAPHPAAASASGSRSAASPSGSAETITGSAVPPPDSAAVPPPGPAAVPPPGPAAVPAQGS
ncbi:hypothetical protein AB8O53_35015, partial [Streptomyces pilosus]